MAPLLIAILIFWPFGTRVETDQAHLVYVPLIQTDRNLLLRYTASGFPFDEQTRIDWCEQGIICTRTDTLDEYVFKALPGKRIWVVRLYMAFWDIGGAHLIFFEPGCVERVCLLELAGSFAGHDLTKARIFVNPYLEGRGGPVHLADWNMYDLEAP